MFSPLLTLVSLLATLAVRVGATQCLSPGATLSVYTPFDGDGSGSGSGSATYLTCVGNLSFGLFYEVHVSKPAWAPAVIRIAVGGDADAQVQGAEESEKKVLQGGESGEIIPFAIRFERRGPAASPLKGVPFYLRIDQLVGGRDVLIPRAALTGLALPIVFSVFLLVIILALVAAGCGEGGGGVTTRVTKKTNYSNINSRRKRD